MRCRDESINRQKAINGFTLLEVLVALAIMAIAVTMVIQLFSSNLRTLATTKDITRAATLADGRMRDILSGESFTERNWTENTEDGYHFDVSVSEISKDRTDNLPVKLMEVIVTARWVTGRKEKSISLRSAKMVEKMTAAE